MPIYEYYCPDNHTIYQFYAKTLSQGQITPKCPDNPEFQMKKLLSTFAVTSGSKESGEPKAGEGTDPGMDGADDPKMEAAMSAMEREFSSVDENDPRAMARMMRRMAELTGERLEGEMEEVVRKLEEGADPEALEEQMGDAFGDEGGGGDEYGESPTGPEKTPDAKEQKHRFKVRRAAPRRDPKLYDYT